MDECLLYAEPALYDLLFPRSDADIADEARKSRIAASEQFYIEEASRGGNVLELACGSGRLTVQLAQKGIDIVGADLSASMLQAARDKAAAAGLRIEFVEADMRSFDFGRRFSTILIPGNSLLHLLGREDLMQCLACVRRHLAAGGRLDFRYFEVEHRGAGARSGDAVSGFDGGSDFGGGVGELRFCVADPACDVVFFGRRRAGLSGGSLRSAGDFSGGVVIADGGSRISIRGPVWRV